MPKEPSQATIRENEKALDQEAMKDVAEVEPDSLDPNAPSLDPDLPETDSEDLGGEGDDDLHDPLDVVIPLTHAKQLVEFTQERGYVELSEAFLAVEAGESITIRVEAD